MKKLLSTLLSVITLTVIIASISLTANAYSSNGSGLNMMVGETATLTDDNMTNGKGYSKVWSSSNSSVVSVSGTGKNATVTAKGVGTCTITCKTSYWTSSTVYNAYTKKWETFSDYGETSHYYEMKVTVRHTHDYQKTVTKATQDSAGKIVYKCSICNEVKETTTIPKISTVSLSSTTYVCDGNVKTPSVTVKDSSGNSLKKDTDYTVTYASGRKDMGKYSVKVNFKGNYSGSKTLYFSITPVGETIDKIYYGSGNICIDFNVLNVKLFSGYQAQYSTSKDFSNATTVDSNDSNVSMLIRDNRVFWCLGAPRGATYYVRIRTYKTVSGTDIYSEWSPQKAVYVDDDVYSTKEIVISSGTTSIESKAYYSEKYPGRYANVKRVTIPDTVKSIGDKAFGCGSLESIIIPAGVTEIGYHAFYNCTSLKTVTIMNPDCKIGASAFPSGCTVYYKGSDEYNSHTHNYATLEAVEPTCTATGKSAGTYCTICGEIKTAQTTVAALGHNYETFVIKASQYEDGKILQQCSICGDVKKETVIPKISGIKLSAYSYTYDGKTHKPTVTVTDSKGNKLKEGTDYTVSYPSNCKDAGEKIVSITPKGNYEQVVNKYSCTYSSTVRYAFDITAASSSGFKAKLSSTSYTYDGKTHKPSVTVTDSKGNTISSKYYDVTYASGRKKIGKYKVTVKFKGNYSGAKTLYFKINPKISLSKTSYTYDGKTHKPSVTVKDSSGNKISTKNYTVSYSKGRKSVGKYTVTIEFKNGHSGTYTKTFTIKPKSTSISKVTAKSKGFTVKWKKQATQTTGYQIQYSTSSNFSNAKTVTVSKTGTTSKTISKLKSKKKYYVRV
ncbi:MAG: leucine-rich repeat protein, partial [Clostridiales bacterium]|nr:leucine-rich repeat protein [Clostridiales bacterium]